MILLSSKVALQKPENKQKIGQPSRFEVEDSIFKDKEIMQKRFDGPLFLR